MNPIGDAKNLNAVFALFEMGRVMTLDELAEASGIGRKYTVISTGRLIDRGYVERLENAVFVMTDAGAKAKADGVQIKCGPKGPDTAIARPPIKDTLRQRAWAAMRVLKTFSTEQIAALVEDEPTRNDQDNVRRYCKGLFDAGILVSMPVRAKGAAETSNGFKRYMILNDVGEIAPTLRIKRRDVFDHNAREALPWQS